MFVDAGLFVVSPAFAVQNQTMNHNQASMNYHDVHAKDLIGKTIKSQNGASMGTLSDVVLGKDGRAEFILLSRGGVFSHRYTPVPYKMFISNATNLNNLKKSKNIDTRMSKAQIDKAPTFSSRHFDMNSSRARVCGYFGPQQCAHM
jgi:capsule polysaccharide modification protein KpsS